MYVSLAISCGLVAFLVFGYAAAYDLGDADYCKNLYDKYKQEGKDSSGVICDPVVFPPTAAVRWILLHGFNINVNWNWPPA